MMFPNSRLKELYDPAIMQAQQPQLNPALASPENPQQGVISQNSPVPQQAVSQITNPAQQINPAMQQQVGNEQYPTPLMEMYRNFLQQPPPQQQQPGIGRRILAGLAGMGSGGLNATDYVLNQPYYKQREAYDTRAKQLGEGANVEERLITNKRNIAANERLAGYREDALGLRAELGQEKAENDRLKNDRIYETKQRQLEQDLDKANQQLEFKKSEAERNQGNVEALRALHEAEMRMKEASHALDRAQRDKHYADLEELYKAQAKNLEDLQKNRGRANDIKENPPPTTVESVRKDASGKPTESLTRTTTKGEIANQAAGMIWVRRKSDGKLGQLPARNFDPKLYEKASAPAGVQ